MLRLEFMRILDMQLSTAGATLTSATHIVRFFRYIWDANHFWDNHEMFRNTHKIYFHKNEEEKKSPNMKPNQTFPGCSSTVLTNTSSGLPCATLLLTGELSTKNCHWQVIFFAKRTCYILTGKLIQKTCSQQVSFLQLYILWLKCYGAINKAISFPFDRTERGTRKKHIKYHLFEVYTAAD